MPTSPTLGRRSSRERSAVTDSKPTSNTRNAKRKRERDEEEGANHPKKAALNAEEVLAQVPLAAIGQKAAEAVDEHEYAAKQVSEWTEKAKNREACRIKLQRMFEIKKGYGECLNAKSMIEEEKEKAEATLERQQKECEEAKKRANEIIQEVEAKMGRLFKEVDVKEWNEVFQMEGQEGDEEEDLYGDN
ncbi:hypothetical protein BHE90_012321 [Fusarium euwallaceae]|uniref:Uncharacterized protein n=2 Tax=Fusarium solani species complex TaxID=232080 RepID=A0A430LC18_9HYPO|nr:hypothetical protein CEP51_016095 [Fusarium floridanum]RTE73257.1 hypothetical protein BHE90_012321 [Fusarium euwallaceae]